MESKRDPKYKHFGTGSVGNSSKMVTTSDQWKMKETHKSKQTINFSLPGESAVIFSLNLLTYFILL